MKFEELRRPRDIQIETEEETAREFIDRESAAAANAIEAIGESSCECIDAAVNDF